MPGTGTVVAMEPISLDELRARRATVATDLAARGLAGALVSDPANVRYLTGLALEQPWHSRTRPTACLLDAAGTVVVIASVAVELDDPPVDDVVRYTPAGRGRRRRRHGDRRRRPGRRAARHRAR